MRDLRRCISDDEGRVGDFVKPNKRREITVETERLLIIRRRYRAVEAWCDGCRDMVVLIRPDQAAAVLGCSLRAIFRHVEAGALHFTEQSDGMLLICLSSLLGQTTPGDIKRSEQPPP